MPEAKPIPLPRLRLGLVPIRLHGEFCQQGELRVRAGDIVACRVRVVPGREAEAYQMAMADYHRLIIFRAQEQRHAWRRGGGVEADFEEIVREPPPPAVPPDEVHVFIRVRGVDTEYRVSETLERIEEIMRDS